MKPTEKSVPSEVWDIAYDPENLKRWKDGYPANTYRGEGPFPDFPKLPVNIGQIDFPKLIEALEDELSECYMSQLHGLLVKEEQALACVELVRWLRGNGRL